MTDTKPIWEIIFAASRVNGGLYVGDHLPVQSWEWPTGTWFEQRREQIRKEQSHEEVSKVYKL